ncbi:MAG TPA: transglutaminase family protein [Elusimicrobiota bacterium]|nr:transglutaminase family protein [Elusimicrobiota bacterium]
MSLDETALRSLVALLDDEDPRSLALVRSRLFDVGPAAIPFLEAAREASPPDFAARLESMTEELRYREVKGAFLSLAAERVPDLENGAFLLSRFVRPRAEPGAYRTWLDRVARAAGDAIAEDATASEAVARLSAHLFQSMGFAGNETNYYDPDNSCLTRVIDTRRGIPVTLSLLYLLVAKRLKLPVYGVGTPGHFLLGFREDGEAHFLDAFRQGRRLEAAEVRRMLVRNGYEFRPEYLKPCGPREILARTMRNLLSIYQKTGAVERAERLSILVEIVVTGRDPGEDA